MKLLILITLLISCSKQYVIKKWDYDKPSCRVTYTPKGTSYNTEQECKDSKEYKEEAEKFKYVIIYDTYYSCRSAIDIEKYKLKQVSETRFDTYEMCSNSQEIKELSNKKSISQEKTRKNKIYRFVKKYPQYKSYKKTALNKKISLGMPEELLLLSWGKPAKINKSVGSFGVHKQYVYTGQYVYVENGKISSWQN